MLAVVGSVADVVREVRTRSRPRSTRRRPHRPRATALVSPSLAANRRPGEQEQVLRPLPRPQRDERGAPDRARYGDGGHGHRPDGRRPARRGPVCRAPLGSARRPCGQTQEGGITGRRSSNRLPVPSSLSSSIRPPSATASSRAIARPSPVPPPSRDQNGRKIRSLLGGDPRPGVRDRRPRRCRSLRRARARSGRRRASSGTRSRAGWRRSGARGRRRRRSPARSVRFAAVVDPAPPRLLAERRVRLLDQAAPCRPPRAAP